MAVGMKPESSAEGKLLKIIRQQDRERSSAVREESTALGMIKATGHFFKIFNSVLIVLSLIFIIIVYQKWSKKEEMVAVLKDEFTLKGKPPPSKKIPLEIPKPYSYFEDLMAKRNIFISPVPEMEMTPPVSPPQPVKQLPKKPDFTQNLNLVGIILSDNPEAVIEHRKSKDTLFVKKGDRIEEAVVEDIREGKVILNYDGERMELELLEEKKGLKEQQPRYPRP